LHAPWLVTESDAGIDLRRNWRAAAMAADFRPRRIAGQLLFREDRGGPMNLLRAVAIGAMTMVIGVGAGGPATAAPSRPAAPANAAGLCTSYLALGISVLENLGVHPLPDPATVGADLLWAIRTGRLVGEAAVVADQVASAIDFSC
jgi:hypothetical protein